MQVQTTALPGVLLLQPQVFQDERGFFVESFNQRRFAQATGVDVPFVQDNHSRSRRGVLRGLHYQLPPHAQGKLVRVVRGRVWDVVADLRRTSPTFGQWLGLALDAEQHQQLWIPPGLAHGFLTLSAEADCLYKTTAYYDPACERGIAWNDADLAIAWPAVEGGYQLSAKDDRQPALARAALPDGAWQS
ncbi:MAG: dTDP-4-dehydrorhamnose 3,5-epimerase [Comamonas sp.]|nr:dTDP-4-dehydrorhamnose 3,5-epimerase [Comamonas sp.]